MLINGDINLLNHKYPHKENDYRHYGVKMMARPMQYEKKTPQELALKVHKLSKEVSYLASEFTLIRGQSNIHSKRLTSIKAKIENLNQGLNEEILSVAVKEKLENNNPSYGDVNYYSPYLKNPTENMLLHAFFSLILSTAKNMGVYDAEQIWNRIELDVSQALLRSESLLTLTRGLLDNHFLEEGINQALNQKDDFYY